MRNKLAVAANFNAFAERCISMGVITMDEIVKIRESETACARSPESWVLNWVTLEILNVVGEVDAMSYLQLRREARQQEFFALV